MLEIGAEEVEEEEEAILPSTVFDCVYSDATEKD